jgi:hypothetical protein
MPTTDDRRADAMPPRWLLACAAGPGVLLAVVTVVMLALAPAGHHPAWPGGELTLAEAAALRDRGEVARQLMAGADPNARYEMRAGVLDDRRATPLAAAVAADRGEIVSLLLARGARPDEEEWTRLSCLARRAGSRDVELTLSRWHGGARAACDATR